MAPHTFGETWGEKYILTLFPEFIKATKQKLSFAFIVMKCYGIRKKAISKAFQG